MINRGSIKLTNRSATAILLFLLMISCGQKEGELFKTPSAKETGIDFTNTITETDDLNILDYLYFYNGGGVAVGDINNDGLVDIFFTGNQVKNRLYLNKGNLQFEDISESASIAGNSSWNTGVVMGDVNGDGLLDIYVCAVVGLNGFNGHNELYINNGDLTFTESATQYGLDFESYSSTASFLDYDLDGDLDIYLLNHAVHTQESFGRAELRNKRNYQTGDKLLRNDQGKFTDISEEAGIFGGINSYGLGVATGDFNQDGYPDIYVSNDFHEDDYYYLNNGNGTFSESLKEFFGHTTRFSMGSDVADINHDGWPDILTLDMLPEDETVLKSSDGDESLQILNIRIKQYGYHYQFTRNMLHINQQNNDYVETALMSGVAATDWSWSGLFADYNQDGEQDLFISNGIPKRPNNLDFIKFISDDKIKNKINNSRLVDQEAIDMMPSGKSHNYIFKGNKGIVFDDKSSKWIHNDSLVSGATAFGDLDNDGDLDLVVNNLNDPVTLYINKTDLKSNYLKIRLNYKAPNTFGIGSKVFAYSKGELQYKELYTSRGFQASSEPIIHFGFNQLKEVDSLRIIWPDGKFQTLKNIATNQTITISPENTQLFDYQLLKIARPQVFVRTENDLGIDYVHKEDAFLDFNREKLIPYRVSDRGPATAVGDLNEDGTNDIFFGSSIGIPSKIYFENDSVFTALPSPEILNDSIKEDRSAAIIDLNNDGKNDLFIGTGGGYFTENQKELKDQLFIQQDTAYLRAELPSYFGNASVVKANDYDQDGDLDLFIGNHTTSADFGNIPTSFFLENDKGSYVIKELSELENIGMITDAVWDDFDNDGLQDLIVVGEWMSPLFFKNDNGSLQKLKVISQAVQGLYQSIQPFDIDQDGDTDYLLGNWGTNSKFKASEKKPMKMYYHDFDQNGRKETVIAIEKKGSYYPLYGLDALSGQMIKLRKRFTSYKDFAGKTMEEIFGKESLKNAQLLTVDNLLSGYLKNENGSFNFIPFPDELQVSPITSFLRFDFDKNGQTEVLAGGNYFGVEPFHGRFDSFAGTLIKNDTNFINANHIGLNINRKAVRHLNIIYLRQKPYLLVTINNDRAQVYTLKNY